MLADGLFPILARAVNYYAHWQVDSAADGRIHLPTTFSPEYPRRGPDTNYDLALYRWGLETLLELCDGGHVPACERDRVRRWRDTLDRLVAYPVDARDGFMIAATVPLSESHRHFSHLMMLWPLELLDLANASQRALAERSVDHWIGLQGALTGFARPAVSAMSTMLGRRAAAYSNVTYLLANYVLPNTMYREGANAPCGETPPMAAAAMQDWMLLSRRLRRPLPLPPATTTTAAPAVLIDVFPGVDDAALPEAAFYALRADGAFLVAAQRTRNITRFVRIHSERGAPCALRTDLPQPYRVDPPTVRMLLLPDGVVLLQLAAGQAATLYSARDPGPFVIRPALGQPDRFNAWGVRDGGPRVR